MRDRISWSEPWLTLLFGALGIALLNLSEERRLASVLVLRAEAEQTALLRRTMVYLALRDQINSPLQSLAMSASLFGGQRGEGVVPDHAELSGAVEQLVALSRKLPREDAVEKSGLIGVSLDSAAELRPRFD
jgi:hypothetical protein